jgi:cellulose synthase/poly-beta-1,6-N-acetylglucosamine synthase-like glycosyltransferase
MYDTHGLVLLILDSIVLGYLIFQPLSRRFDDSDRGAGNLVRLPPFRRPSWPRVSCFFVMIIAVNVYVAALRGAPLIKAYRVLVANVLRTLVVDPVVAAYYASKLVPLVPATMLSFMAIMAIVLPATPGRRLMILAHGFLFLAVSVASTCFLAVVAIAVGAAFGPLPLIDLLMQESLAYFVIYRFAFTSFQYPRVTQVPSLGRGRWQAHVIMVLALIGSICVTGTIAVWLIPLAGGQLLVAFLILRGLRAGILDWVYVLLGIVRLAGGRQPRPGPSRPPLEVIIPAFNEAVVIERTLRSIDRAAGRYGSDVRVILCDDGSTDDTRALAEATMAEFRYAVGEVIQGPHAGKAVALNLALARCVTDYVYRIDADCALDPNAFGYSIAQFLKYPDVGLVGAFVLPKEPYTTWIDRMRALEMIFSFGFARVMLAEVDAVPCIPGTFCAFRRRPAVEIGGFIDGTLGEDVFFTCEMARLGYRAAVDPRVISYEDVPTTLKQLRVQRFRWSKGGIMSFAAFTPFGDCGAPSPRNWFKMPMGAGKGLLKPFGTSMMLLTLAYSIIDPAVQHNLVRFGLLLVATQIPAIIPRLVVMAYYRRLALLPWMVTWFPFSLLKRFFMIEAILSFGLRPVKPPLALRSHYPTWGSFLHPAPPQTERSPV